MCPDFPQKWQTHASLLCVLPLGGLGVLGLDSWRSTLIFLGGVTSTDLALLIEGLMTSLTGGLEEEEGTKFVKWGADIEMLSTKPKTVLLEGDFWTLSMWSSLELTLFHFSYLNL